MCIQKLIADWEGLMNMMISGGQLSMDYQIQ